MILATSKPVSLWPTYIHVLYVAVFCFLYEHVALCRLLACVMQTNDVFETEGLDAYRKLYSTSSMLIYVIILAM